VDENINHETLTDLEEAFFHFLQAGDVEKGNKTGDLLSNFLYSNSQYQSALLVAGQTYDMCGEQTATEVLNTLGLIFNLFGERKKALFFHNKKVTVQAYFNPIG
jgi:hypothetical protein